MSENDSDDGGATSKSDSSSELDVGATRFNPLKALYSTKMKVPVAKAKLHDNVQTLEAKQTTLGGFEHKYDEERIKQIRAQTTKKKVPEFNASEPPKRRFLPEQGLVSKPLRARYARNVLTRMDAFDAGPMAKLKQWMDQRTRVRIYTRKQKGIRGHISGYIEIFDKLWNMAVSDVTETWRRRKYRYSENNIDPDAIEAPQDCSARLRQLGIALPPVKARCDGKKYVICTRTIPQLMIIGEQVVLVTPEPPEAPKESASRDQK